MLKNISRLEFKIADKVYHLTCDHDSPLGHVKEAVLQFLRYIQNIEDEVAKQQEQQIVEPVKENEPEIKSEIPSE